MHNGSQHGGPVSGRCQSTASRRGARPRVASPRQELEWRYSACQSTANVLAVWQAMHVIYGRLGAPD